MLSLNLKCQKVHFQNQSNSENHFLDLTSLFFNIFWCDYSTIYWGNPCNHTNTRLVTQKSSVSEYMLSYHCSCHVLSRNKHIHIRGGGLYSTSIAKCPSYHSENDFYCGHSYIARYDERIRFNGCFVCWSLTSLCHSNGHIETMPARKINPFTALTRIRYQFLRTQWSMSNHSEWTRLYALDRSAIGAG